MESKTFEIQMMKSLDYGFTSIIEKGRYDDDPSYLCVATGTATMTQVDETQQRLDEIAQLERQKKAVLVEAEEKRLKIDEKIQTLLAISYDGDR